MMHMNNNNNNNRVKRTPSKVISIPVHFVGSERSRTESATKIQRVAKGFLVRKSVKKMISMKVELEEMENTVNAPETVELMKKEQKEKVRIAETIMNLLLKLDSVRVFHCSALRDFRKSLIKRAIVIQEFVDEIQLVPPTQVSSAAENEMNDHLVNEVEGQEEEHEEEQEEGEKMGMDDEREESVGTNLVEEDCVVKVKQEEKEEEEEKCKGGDDGNKEMLKRMMEENEKMMNMMTQLFERNEMQTSLLTSLTQRVDQLERAFTFDRLRRKKRRNLDAKSKLTHPKNGCN